MFALSGPALNPAAFNKFVAANSAFNPTTATTQVGEGEVYFSADYQMKPYAVRWSQGDPGTGTQVNVNEVVWFFLPVAFGTPVEVGTHGRVDAGEAANGGNDGLNTALTDFSDTIASGGCGAPQNANGTPSGITDFARVSGIDYNRSFIGTPEPQPVAVPLAAMLGLGFAPRLRGRQA